LNGSGGTETARLEAGFSAQISAGAKKKQERAVARRNFTDCDHPTRIHSRNGNPWISVCTAKGWR
jgi:hypothetical protein